jgi:hypothetical protein
VGKHGEIYVADLLAGSVSRVVENP